MDEIRVLTPCGGLGYGFPQASIDEGMRRKPHIIAVDAGSTDPGPHYLGSGDTVLSWQAQKRDLEILLAARDAANIPLVVGSAGLSGSKTGVDKTLEIIREIAATKGYKVNLTAIYADIDKTELSRALTAGRVQDFEHPDTLTTEAISNSSNIVAQMGPEPIIAALKDGADVIIAGRAYDPAMMAALPIMQGLDKGLAIHMGKILECGTYAAEPSTATDAMLGTIRADHFIVEPLNPALRCTVDSVSAHTMYEKESPVELALPGGVISLKDTVFEAVDDRTVKVSGTKFTPGDIYAVKLEGAAPVGYRSVFISGTRDPILVDLVDDILEGTKAKTATGLGYDPATYQLTFHVYGKNGVMGANESVTQGVPHELGIVCEAVGETQQAAHDVCSFAAGTLLHYPYEGRKATAGNLAFPHSPATIDAGPVYQFSIYHLLEVNDPVSLFVLHREEVTPAQLEEA